MPAQLTFELFRTVVNDCNRTILDALAGFEMERKLGNKAREIPREMTGLNKVEPWLGSASFDQVFDVGLTAVLDGFELRRSRVKSRSAQDGRR